MRNPFDVSPLRAQPLPGQSQEDLDRENLPGPPEYAFDATSDRPPPGQVLDVTFAADWREYFRLWVVCQLLTLLTLGWYGPWARVRRVAFLARHWKIDGHPFEARLDPQALLQGRLLLLVLLFAALALMFFKPTLTSLLVVASFLPLPWLMAHSFAFRWRTLRHRGLAFDADTPVQPLQKPLWMLGLGMAVYADPLGLVELLGSSPVWLGLVALCFAFALAWLWTRAIATLTGYRFSKARWGATPFELDATPEQILDHMWMFIVGRGLLLSVALAFAALLAFGAASGNRDVQAALNGLAYLMATVFGVTFARGRRLNFVLHRLRVGGLSFSSTLEPGRAALLTTGYALLALLTLGLSIPWSTVHYARWRSQRVQAHLQGGWDQFSPAAAAPRASGIMDELANSFDIEIGI